MPSELPPRVGSRWVARPKTGFIAELGSGDLSPLLRSPDERTPIDDILERAEAKLASYTPMTVADRFESFKRIHYQPHGLYVPDDEAQRDQLRKRLHGEIGCIPEVDVRLRLYRELQYETEQWQLAGVEGRWTGQQAIARSAARFRIVAWGRRGGKTFAASREALGVAVLRPRSFVWLAGPTMKLVTRCFDMVYDLVADLGLGTTFCRNTTQEKLIVLDNGARIEGVSLENVLSAAGAAVDFAVIDEAAQIFPEAWYRAILPPLTDRGGQALLISSYEGEGDFFHTKAMEALAEKISKGTDSLWDMFQDASWETNFYRFPQGRQTPEILQAEKEMPPIEFLEQFGAIPAGERERTYPEFRAKVHVGNYPFNPDHPVILAADPSAGINPYAILAIQDYGEYTFIIDEYYETFVSAEQISKELNKRPWRANVTEMVVDSAWPAEIVRWCSLGLPAYPVHAKPRVEERLPLVRNLLREPVRYLAVHRRKVNEVLRSMGFPDDSDDELSSEQQKRLVIQVEESLSDALITQADIKALRDCARLFTNHTCVNTIIEWKVYSFHRRRQINRSYREQPRMYKDHCMDVVGYFAWMYKRGDAPLAEATSYIAPNETPEGPIVIGPPGSDVRRRRWIDEMRSQLRAADRGVSYLRAV